MSYRKFVEALSAFSAQIAEKWNLKEETKFGSTRVDKAVWSVPYKVKIVGHQMIMEGYLFIQTNENIDEIVDWILNSARETPFEILEIRTQINDERRRTGIIEVAIQMVVSC